MDTDVNFTFTVEESGFEESFLNTSTSLLNGSFLSVVSEEEVLPTQDTNNWEICGEDYTTVKLLLLKWHIMVHDDKLLYVF